MQFVNKPLEKTFFGNLGFLQKVFMGETYAETYNKRRFDFCFK